MAQIYCLITKGGQLTNEVSDLLLQAAYDMLDGRSRRKHIRMDSEGLTGEVTTDNKIAFMGTITGIVFSANFDCAQGTIKTEYVVKPVKNRSETDGGRWITVPMFPIPMPNPALN